MLISEFSLRDKSILLGLYLSKFDKKGLIALGFNGFVEAYNTLGYAIGAKPASLKNYRDEFDPLFPNVRKGWHKRPIREYCKKFYEEYSFLKFDSFTELIKSLIFENYDIEKLTKSIKKEDRSESVAKRLITGKSAEEYFKIHYRFISEFNGYELKDATNLACGFDFKLSLNSDYYCVEVKGLNKFSGSISMTEKEYSIANKFKNKYCLFVVSNFIEKPNHQLFFDPLHCRLAFKKAIKNVTQINYLATI